MPEKGKKKSDDWVAWETELVRKCADAGSNATKALEALHCEHQKNRQQGLSVPPKRTMFGLKHHARRQGISFKKKESPEVQQAREKAKNLYRQGYTPADIKKILTDSGFSRSRIHTLVVGAVNVVRDQKKREGLESRTHQGSGLMLLSGMHRWGPPLDHERSTVIEKAFAAQMKNQ
jgi:hypothetical protein